MAFWLIVAAQAAGLSATNYAADAPLHVPAAPPSWTDEFDGDRIDPARWRFDTGQNRTGWPNHELEYYAAGAANTRVANGALTIEARHDAPVHAADYGGQAYSSARLVSREAFGYGFYEVRAKLPCGRGTWPAIWLLPDSGTWPAMGEIDVMEMVGFDPDVIHATLHTGKFNHRLNTQRGAQVTVPSACTAFHRYQLSWRPHEILIGVDDRAYLRVADDQPGGAAAWPFTRPFHMILNVAVGGDWGGQAGHRRRRAAAADGGRLRALLAPTGVSATVTRLAVGRDRQPVVVIDGLAEHPEALRTAATAASFGPAHHLYPGIRADLPAGYLAAIMPTVAAAARAFGDGALETIDASFSMVTTPPADLSVAQRLPHCDAFDPRCVALVHYLSDGGGGTAFYRHRSTGFETIDEDRRAIFYDQLEAELRHGGPPEQRYLDGDTRLFERIALVEPRANRAVFYRSFLLHSGAIPADAALSADPAQGRLTVTGFFRLTA